MMRLHALVIIFVRKTPTVSHWKNADIHKTISVMLSNIKVMLKLLSKKVHKNKSMICLH